MESVDFESGDVDRVEAFVSRLYSKMTIGATGAATHAHITRQVMAPGIGFDDLDYSFDIGYSAEPPDKLIICDVLSSTIRRCGDPGQDDETFGPGEQFLISRPGMPYGGLAHAPKLQFTLIDPAILASVTSTDGSSVRLLDHRPVSSAAAQHLKRTVAFLRDNVLSNPVARETPLLISTASQYLAASVLHAYANTAEMETPPHDCLTGQPAAIRRAIAFMDANAHSAIDLSGVAEAAYVSPRALQYAFRRHLDTTPMAYLRTVRLDGAHRSLMSADPEFDTVTSIAARWGFANPGRFAALYQQTYGRTPRAALHS